MKSEKWIPVLVPLDLLSLVTKALEEAVAARGDIDPAYIVIGGGDHAPVSTPISRPVGNTGGVREANKLLRHQAWSLEDLARLAEGHTLTTERWTKALDVCSEAGPGVWLSTSEIARRSGMTINEWRDAPRKIPRHLKKHYVNVPVDEDGEQFWPLAFDNRSEVWWAITAEQKERWDKVRAAASSAAIPS